MTSALPCNVIQERIVAGEPLDDQQQMHVIACTSCAALAAEVLAIDSTLSIALDNHVKVPDGFADAVMAAIGDVPRGAISRLLDRRAVQIVLANIGVAMAIGNLLRFVFSLLVPTTSLGGTP